MRWARRLLASAARATRGARHPATALRAWWRPAPPTGAALDDVRRRLELLLAALYDRPIRVEAAAPERESVLRRIVRRRPGHLRPAAPLAATDGDSVRLPAALDGTTDAEATIARWRLLAVEQGERLARGTAAHAPPSGATLERDLYLLCEAAAVDAAIARRVGGLRATLRQARAAALARRPSLGALTPVEREVERLVRGVLSGEPVDASPLAPDATPADARAWARATAARLSATAAGRYRGVPPVELWGTVLGGGAAPGEAPPRRDGRARGGPTAGVGSAPRPRPGQGSAARDAGTGDTPDERGEASRTVGGDAEPGASAAPRLDAAPSLDPVDEASRVAPSSEAPTGDGTAYPEWDCAIGRHGARPAIVRVAPAEEGDGAWAERVLAEHAVLVRRVRQRFERLRSRRARLYRERDGDELDLAACVQALVDRRAGRAMDDRLYVAVRPARRSLAIALLADVSGSTDAPLTGDRRIIDVEKVALLLAAEALDALGDPYAMLTFSSRGAADVRVTVVKDFAERGGASVRRRVAAVAPSGNTRLGAAVRDATARLARQDAGHRLLLILSDGKPSDTDRYYDRYAIEDSRQSVLEARARGVTSFCLTVDREAPGAYMSHVFGSAGHTILRNTDHLPLALLGAVRQLLGTQR